MLDVQKDKLQEELAGMDALELADRTRVSFGRRAWTATWPKLAALVVAIGLWQLVVWSGWKPEYVIPGPGRVFSELQDQLTSGKLLPALWLTLGRAARGYALALVLGAVVGIVVSRSKVLRSAFGSFITGLQTMPSVTWFPFALIVFKKSEAAILFVVVLGAAPSIANGLISGIDQVPPLYVRAGRVLGAGRMAMYRFVILPAALPNVIGGLKQGWAFAWRSLMAGELLVIIANQPSIGVLLSTYQNQSDMPSTVAIMMVILVIGILVDQLFNQANGAIRRRWGLVGTT
jgi:NitT/TauT family transport system permease protein